MLVTSPQAHPARELASALIPLPIEFALFPPFARIEVLVDADALSHGLAEETAAARAPDHAIVTWLDRVSATAASLTRQSPARGAGYTLRCAGSTATARHHLAVVVGSPNNTWSFRRGLDGADRVLLDRLEVFVSARSARGARSGPVDLVVLIGQDHIYAPAVEELRTLGVRTWVLQPGRFIAAELYRAACAVTRLHSDPCSDASSTPVGTRR